MEKRRAWKATDEVQYGWERQELCLVVRVSGLNVSPMRILGSRYLSLWAMGLSTCLPTIYDVGAGWNLSVSSSGTQRHLVGVVWCGILFLTLLGSQRVISPSVNHF